MVEQGSPKPLVVVQFDLHSTKEPLAQQVEQRPFKAWVIGSNPIRFNIDFPSVVEWKTQET